MEAMDLHPNVKIAEDVSMSESYSYPRTPQEDRFQIDSDCNDYN